jgi:hypothetical protein
VQLTATLDAPVTADRLFAHVATLDRYPAWLTIVPVATPTDDGAWLVQLRGRIGPLARSKGLRMVRTGFVADQLAVFERRELDGRSHAPWRLTAAVETIATGSRLTMDLHYGGSLWGPVIERLLHDEIDRSRRQLLALVTS